MLALPISQRDYPAPGGLLHSSFSPSVAYGDATVHSFSHHEVSSLPKSTMETRKQADARSTATNSTSSTRKRKARSTPSADENSGDDSKKRGRPRVEKPDESAADRRRTQIRMAQRAYRQRKESTLEELRKRVSELTNTMELMNKAFLDHRDRLYRTTLPQTQLEDVRETGLQFESLMKCVRNPSEDSPDEPPARLHRESSSSVHGSNSEQPHPTLLEPKNVPSWLDRSVLASQPRQRDPTTVGMGYTLFMEEEGAHPTIPHDYLQGFETNALLPTSQEPYHNSQQQHQQQQQQHHNYDIFRLEVPEVSMPHELSPPRTYSFQESTFGRRLHRGAVEQGYHLLLDPSRRPSTYQRVFRLCLMNQSREKTIAMMKSVLDAGPHESLTRDAALIHIGGAGTHYPRRDQFGHLQPKKDSWHMGVVGPQTLALLESSVKDNITVDMTVNIAGFEGEWFDPYDVEGYLAEKGIFIDPSSSFAEAEVFVENVPAENDSSTEPTLVRSSGGHTPPTAAASPHFQASGPARPFDHEQMDFLHVEGLDPSTYNSWATISTSTVGFSDASTGSWMNFMQPGAGLKTHMPPDEHMQDAARIDAPSLSWEGSKSTEYFPKSKKSINKSTVFISKATDEAGSGRKKTIILDVTKFLKILVVSGVCLSRTPGYKRKDVDRALALASFDAF